MNWGGLAAMIAAIAFAVLVVFLALFIKSLTKTIESVTETVDEVTNMLAVLKKDVDGLSLEAQGLLNKTNTLLDDVNYKVGKIDPLFTAIGDVGVSLSEVNGATRDLVLNVTNSANEKVDELKSKMSDDKVEAVVAKEERDQLYLAQTAQSQKISGRSRLSETAKRIKERRLLKKKEKQSQTKVF